MFDILVDCFFHQLKNGSFLDDIWKMEDASVDTTGMFSQHFLKFFRTLEHAILESPKWFVFFMRRTAVT